MGVHRTNTEKDLPPGEKLLAGSGHSFGIWPHRGLSRNHAPARGQLGMLGGENHPDLN